MNKPAERKKTADGGMVIPCKSEEFIRAWLEILRSVHKLTRVEMNVTACIIEKYFELKDVVKDKKDKNLINKLLFQQETKEQIAAKAGVTPNYFKSILLKLRKQGIIKGKEIQPTYLPDWEPGKPFRWLFIFKNEP